MTSPSSGVSPIEVSTLRPPSTAHALRAVAEVQHDHPHVLERRGRAAPPCGARHEGVRACRGSRSGGRGARRARRAARRRCRPPAAACGGTRCRRPRRAACRGTRPAARTMPSTLAGLCSGASGDERRAAAATTSSSTTTGSVNRRAAVHDPVPDRDEVVVVEPRAVLGERGASGREARRRGRGSRSSVSWRPPVGLVRGAGSRSPIRSTSPTATVTPARRVDRAGTSATTTRR